MSGSGDRYRFHAAIHARAAEVTVGSPVAARGGPVAALEVPAAALERPLAITFESASRALAALPRLLIEPDGSFVWVGEASGEAWQLDGVLYDRHERLLFVDLKGNCPAEAFDRLLGALGWPEEELMFQWIEASLFVDLPEFRRLAAAAAATAGVPR